VLKKLALSLLVFLSSLQLVSAQESKHEIRVGWGDQMFESIVWHATAQPIGLLPESKTINYNENYRRLQHSFLEYSYTFSPHFSLGLMFDFSGVKWDNVTVNGVGEELERQQNRCFYNIIAMPTMRVNYFLKRYVSFYSGIGAGMNVNTGTETDIDGRKTEFAPALYLDIFSVKAKYKYVFAAADFGGLISMRDINNVYLCGSRMFSVSVGVNF